MQLKLLLDRVYNTVQAFFQLKDIFTRIYSQWMILCKK